MSRNGSGVYSLAAGNPVTTGTTISSSWANNTLTDIASALTASIASDGQTVITANLPMSTYAHTGVGVATARTMYGTAGQIQDNTLTYLTTVAGTNVITAVAPVLMSAYATGQTFYFIAAGGNTGAVTVNINAIGAKSVKKTDGSALISGDILTGAAVQIMYDGTNFQLLSDSNGTNETVGNLTVTGTTTATGLITANGGVSGALNGSLGATTPSTAVVTSLTDSALTSGRVTYASTGGLLADSASLTFDGTTLSTVGLTTTGNTILGNASTDTLNVGNGDLIKDASGNLGLGVTPSAWATLVPALQLGAGGAFISGQSGTASTIYLGTNAHYNGTFIYKNTDYASYYSQVNSTHAWFTAPSGTAGNAITFTQAMTLDAGGNFLVGTTSATSKVVIKCSTNNFNGGLQLHQSNFDTRWEYLVGSDGKLYLGYGVGATPSAVGNFASNGTYTATSDIRKKKDITYDFNATEIVMRLKPAMGRMIDDADESPLRPFYIAQDMKEVVPSLVSNLDPDQDAIDPIMGVDYASSVPLLAKMLQEQQAMIEELKAKVAALEAA